MVWATHGLDALYIITTSTPTPSVAKKYWTPSLKTVPTRVLPYSRVGPGGAAAITA
ncbi:Uncharacterised protein [Mycobacteroides abscessus subsp. massiliense]|nr:Uncharacterised protein [Mycobacteroides abscessus subsp. massiliense]